MKKRDMFTIGCWILFLAGIVGNHILQNHQILAFAADVVASMIFGKLMFVRADFLDYPDRSWRCNWGLHDCSYKDGEWMSGTGEYIRGEEITRKKYKTTRSCKKCSYKETTYY